MGRSVSVLATTLIAALVLASTSETADARRRRSQPTSACFDTRAGDDDTISGCTDYLNRSGITTTNRAIAHFNRAISYYNKEDYDSAIQDYDEAIRINRNYVAAYNNRGNCYQAKREHDRAIRDYSEAIRLNPKNTFAHNNRGNSYVFKGDYDRAIRDYDEAIRLDPNYTMAYANRGDAYEKKGDLDRARASYRAALAAPEKYSNGKYAHEKARTRLTALDEQPSRSSDSSGGGTAREDDGLRDRVRRAQDLLQVEEARPAPAVAALPGPSAAAQQPPGRRVALVIGNSAYAAVEKLPNARADAEAVASTLRGTGYEKVSLETDLTREKLLNALRAFAREAESADWATVYFAGHGIEMNGVNYMIPIDAKLAVDRDLEFEAVPLDRLMSAVDGAKKLRLVMLDACRDNPFLNQMRRSVATRSIGRGLAQIEPEAGTLVVYAAKHGQVALDGEGKNSPFVSALVSRIKTPGLEVRRLFDLVRDDVVAMTKRRQQPFSYGSVSGSEDFFFVPK
jgi:lipoprotein NlpI